MPIPLVLAGVIAAVGGGGVGVGVWIGRRLERSLNPQPSNCGAIFYGNPQSQPDRLPIPKANTDYPDGRTPDIPTSDLALQLRFCACWLTAGPAWLPALPPFGV